MLTSTALQMAPRRRVLRQRLRPVIVTAAVLAALGGAAADHPVDLEFQGSFLRDIGSDAGLYDSRECYAATLSGGTLSYASYVYSLGAIATATLTVDVHEEGDAPLSSGVWSGFTQLEGTATWAVDAGGDYVTPTSQPWCGFVRRVDLNGGGEGVSLAIGGTDGACPTSVDSARVYSTVADASEATCPAREPPEDGSCGADGWVWSKQYYAAGMGELCYVGNWSPQDPEPAWALTYSWEKDSTCAQHGYDVPFYNYGGEYSIDMTYAQSTLCSDGNVWIQEALVPEAGSAPTVSDVDGTARTMTVAWDAPWSLGAAIFTYDIRVEYQAQGSSQWDLFADHADVGPVRSFVVDGLDAEGSYRVSTRGHNSKGEGAWSLVSEPVLILGPDAVVPEVEDLNPSLAGNGTYSAPYIISPGKLSGLRVGRSPVLFRMETVGSTRAVIVVLPCHGALDYYITTGAADRVPLPQFGIWQALQMWPTHDEEAHGQHVWDLHALDVLEADNAYLHLLVVNKFAETSTFEIDAALGTEAAPPLLFVPPSDGNVHVSDVTSTSVTLKWSPTAGADDGYNVFWHLGAAGDGTMEPGMVMGTHCGLQAISSSHMHGGHGVVQVLDEWATGISSFSLTDLTPGAEYHIEVVARRPTGGGEYQHASYHPAVVHLPLHDEDGEQIGSARRAAAYGLAAGSAVAVAVFLAGW